MARNSSFRPQSEWDASGKKSEWDEKPAQKSEWGAPPPASGAAAAPKAAAAAVTGKIDPAVRAVAEKFKVKLNALAKQKAKGGKETGWRAVFKLFDVEGSGQINRLEFKRGLEKVGFDLPREQLQGLQKIYFDGGGEPPFPNTISYKEFCSLAKTDENAGKRKQWEDEGGWDSFDYLTLGFFASDARAYSEYY
mmetsp:Transcript_66900/g.124979  ORF Transcript_66900/g.124979 Transcript_66900/m.124979 type:complete len:193 (+) Transcript_66900:59-637(+)